MSREARKRVACSFLAVGLLGILAVAQLRGQDQSSAKPKLYNKAKQKLLDGKQVFSFTQTKLDIPGYCEAAKHYDFTWFEMQHSTLEFADIEKMIAACPYAGHSDDTAARRSGMAHTTFHRHRRTWRDCSNRRRCG